MAKIMSVSKAAYLCGRLHKTGKKIVLCGGCFDLLHPGHISFLEKARKAGDVLIILLESDRKVKELKGKKRPVQNQKMRATVLSALEAVSFVVCLPYLSTDSDYDEMLSKIKPDVIALTKGYGEKHHKRAARLTGANLKYIARIGNYSTSNILETK